MSELTPEIIEARKKMEEKFGNLKLGGKGTQKKKKVAVHKAAAVQDKKISAIAKKIGSKNLGETSEINLFKDDNTVIHFKKPKLEYSVKEKVSFITGTPETKQIKDMLPGILKQLGPKQLGFIKDYAESLKNTTAKTEEKPDLVEDFEEVSKQN